MNNRSPENPDPNVTVSASVPSTDGSTVSVSDPDVSFLPPIFLAAAVVCEIVSGVINYNDTGWFAGLTAFFLNYFLFPAFFGLMIGVYFGFSHFRLKKLPGMVITLLIFLVLHTAVAGTVMFFTSHTRMDISSLVMMYPWSMTTAVPSCVIGFFLTYLIRAFVRVLKRRHSAPVR